MSSTIKVVNGYYAECDECDNCIHTYFDLHVDQVKQIAFSGNKIVALMQNSSITEYEDRCFKANHFGMPCHPTELQNIQLSGNTMIIQTTNNRTFKCAFGTNGYHWEEVWN